jgi:hypothetical protein
MSDTPDPQAKSAPSSSNADSAQSATPPVRPDHVPVVPDKPQPSLAPEPGPVAAAELAETDVPKLIQRWIITNVPSPLGLALLIGFAAFGTAAFFIEKQYDDFNLLLTLTSFDFSLVAIITAAVWQLCAIVAYGRLGKLRFWAFTFVFTTFICVAGVNAVRMSRLHFSELGFYEEKAWKLAVSQKNGPRSFQWRIEVAKPKIDKIRFRMNARDPCASSYFSPGPDPEDKNGGTQHWTARQHTDPSQENSLYWDVTGMVRDDVVVFDLLPADAKMNPSNCHLPERMDVPEGAK